jgi:hypothetical protein
VRQVSRERVGVFIDWQNLYKGARTAFHGDRGPSRLGMVEPVRLGRRLRSSQARLWCQYLRVDDYRGMVDPTDYTTP